LDDEQPTRSDLKLYEQAFNQEWEIPPAVRTKVIQRMVNLVTSDPELVTVPDKTVIAATRVLIAAAGWNVRREAVEVQMRQLQWKQETSCSGHGDAIDADVIERAEQLAEERRAERAADGAAE
jgi:hypothetical protein